ncbi:hypothetical protein [Exiguobacterium sp. s36]|uniref:hypothetical protein n=1 Tax=Exiguobacterium sp. s36 TaxID=2751227 RepID=UPI001BEB5A80|nr:hypothetical protein [Exiguobacterium sp. s36]
MKKILAFVLGGLMSISGLMQVDAAVTTPNVSKLSQAITDEFKVVGDKLYGIGDRDGLVLYDLKTGTLLRDYETYSSYSKLAVSDDESHVVLMWSYGIRSFNTFGEVKEEIEKIEFGPSMMESFEGGGDFLPNSSVLILSGDEKLTAYDMTTNEVKWMRGAESGNVTTSEHYILVENQNSGRLYTHEGEFVHEWTDVNDISISQSDKVVVVGDKMVSSFGANSYDKPIHSLQVQATIADIESSGQFVTINNTPYTFDLKKIYMNTDFGGKSIDLTASAKYVLATDWDYTYVYLANGFMERSISAYIPSTLQKLTAGTTYNTSLMVKVASGKTTSVKKGVVWTTDKPQIAYVKDGKIVAKSKGTVTLKATYEGLTAKRTVTVLPDPRPSDYSWLLSQKAQMVRGTFVGSPHKLYGDYAKVKGSAGTFESDWGFGYKGRHQGEFMFTSSSKPQKINIITMSPSLQKRDITKYEFQKVFGKPRNSNGDYWETFEFTKAGKKLSGYYIEEVAEYKINNKLPMYVFYDSNYRVRYISLYSK